ncbi:protein IWS1 homolog isoform X1 [Dermacentor silvarum]|uniref:protein IWS1 homolog isoform X1 n=1 Tax=Dermacentor silvarum TaxID=543639 RepID=UPI00189AC2A1|nr:protein IWS1 homolog isoform X1 [Dermacentor silvarum]
MSNSAGSDMEPGSEDEGPCNVASPSPVASPDSNNNSESGQSPPGSDNEDGSGQESGQEDNNDEVTRDSGSEGQGDGAGSGSDNEKNSDAEVRSSPSSPAAENDSATGDRSAGEEENEDGRESRQSSTSGAGGEQGTAEQAQSDSGQQQDDDEAPSCHDSPPASPSPSNTGAEERSSAPSSPVRRNSDDEKDSDREDAKEAGSDKEEDEEDKEDSDKEEDKDDSDNESNVGELIANIFGDSDDESEFEGFGKEDLVSTKKKDKAKKARKVLSDSEEEDDHEDKQEEKVADSDEDEEEKDMEVSVEPEDHEADESEQPAPVAVSQAVPDVSSSDDELEPDSRRSRNSDFMSDFDIMMAKKKEENSKRRKRKDVDIISDTDDIIVEIIKEMKAAAEEDKELNQAKRAATKKLKLLPVVVPQLKKLDLKGAFLDQGVLHVMAEWLAPLPDKSLPHLQIREHMLRLLGEFPPLDQGFLKSSGIGRAVMYLYKHPKESKENRERAGRLINEWARPIFNLNTNYSSISKEEREQKDFERMPQKRKIRMESTEEEPPSKKDIDRALTGEDKSLRPGEKGWVARARVPMPSTKDYVVRPKWNCDTEFVKNTKKTVTRLDKHMRMIQERKKKSKAQRAVTISIEGRHMSL